MATGDAAPAAAALPPPPLTIPPPPVEPLSEDGSSPLSDVEDKEDEHGGLHDVLGSSRQPGLDDGGSHHEDNDDENDDDSDGELSEANDTEAETERLYDTPQSASRRKNVVLDRSAGGHRLERTPTKLRQGMTVNTTAGQDEDEEEEEDALSEPSIASSPPPPGAHVATVADKPPSPSLACLAEAVAANDHQAESRKRKRPSLPFGKPDANPPPRKRTEMATAVEDHDGDVAMADEEDGPTNTTSGEQSADEVANGREADAEPADSADNAEAKVGPRTRIEDDGRTRKQTRSGSKRQKGGRRSGKQEGDEPSHDSIANGAAADEESAHTADDDHPLEVDVAEEAEAAHKNEEEFERKRAAYEQLTNIEKRFATFRDRLYEERLEQLNREEAMLRADNPTHPEYLAMMECVDARRGEKVRIARQELDLNLEALGRWAVARRAQIHSQFYQDVRETRERAVAELGQHWYAIQHERRKHANNVPDFGLRFPQNQAQRVRNALSYNKEVSILSGVAKYEGMPAAPEMRGASLQEMDEDLEIMAVGDTWEPRFPLLSPAAVRVAADPVQQRGRQAAAAPAQQQARPSYTDYGSLNFSLGAAGQQFLEQTAWANPNHPSNAHLLQRQHPSPESRKRSPLPDGSASRRQQSHHGPTSQPFGRGLTLQKNGLRPPSSSPEAARAAGVLEHTSARSLKTGHLGATSERLETTSFTLGEPR